MSRGEVYTHLPALTAFVTVTVLSGCCTSLAADFAHGRARIGELYAASLAIAGASAALMVPFAIAIAVLAPWPSTAALPYGAAAAPFLSLLVFQLALYQAQGDVRRLHYVYLFKSAVTLAVLAVLAVVAPGHSYLFLTVWAGVQAIVPLATLRVQARQARFLWRGSRSLVIRILRRGAPLSVANGIALLNLRIDLVVVAALLPLADVGRYSVATAMAEVLWLLPSAVITGAYARIVTSSVEESARITVRAVRHSAALLLTAALAQLLGTKVLLGPLFGSDFATIWLPLALLLPGIVASGLAEVLRPFFLVRLERSRELIFMASVGSAVNLALAFALVPYFGLAGAAVSTSVSYLGGAFYIFSRFAHLSGTRHTQSYLPSRAEFDDYRNLLASIRPKIRHR